MSSLTQYITKEFVVVPMSATSREEAIDELLEPLLRHQIITPDHRCSESILKRERRMSSGVGKGVALPQGRTSQVSGVALVVGISPAGVDFDSPDGMLCHIIVLFLGPEEAPDKHHKVLSRITKLLSEAELRSSLTDADTVDKVIEILHERDRRDDEAGL